MEIVVCKSVEEANEWDEYVKQSRSATAFHPWAWRRIINTSYGHQSYYLMAKENARVCGILPLVHVRGLWFRASLVSMPFADYGGVCADDSGIRTRLTDAATELGRTLNVHYIEFRDIVSTDLDCASNFDKVSMLLELLPNSDEMLNSLPTERRNRIRKAIKSNVTARMYGVDGVDLFYKVFAENMRDLGSPVHSKVFFQQIMEAFPESARIILIHVFEKVIGGAVCLMFKDSLLIPWVSSLKRFRDLYPNVLLYWEAMKYGIQSGAKELDFGRSSKGSGTFEFKRQWGAAPRQLYWHYFLLRQKTVPNLSAENPTYRPMVEAWKRLPVSLSTILGPVVRRSIPA